MTRTRRTFSQPTLGARRRHGTALPETLLVLPILFVIAALVLYFGRGMLRVQHTQVMDRAEAWRGVTYHDDGTVSHTTRDGALDVALQPRNFNLTDLPPTPPHGDAAGGRQLNQAFLGNKASDLDGDTRAGFDDIAGDTVITEADLYSADTGALARAQIGALPTSQRTHFTTTYPTERGVWSRFNGGIYHGSTRIGHDWAYVNGWRALRITWADLAASGRWIGMAPYPSSDPMLATKLLLIPPDPLDNPDAVPGDGGGCVVVGRSYGYDVWQHTMPNATNVSAVRDVFLLNFDQAVEAVADQNRLAAHIRGSYLHQPPYRGPTLESPPPDP
jgi:hypothetical protein